MFLEKIIRHNKKSGWIEIICGSMFSGKTEELIRRVKRVKLANQKIKIFKSKLDTRYSDNKIISHNQNFISSISVKNSSEINILSNDCHVVAIDEAQFFDIGIVDVCNTLANNGNRVIIAGLDMDYKGRPFGPMPYLMATAEYITKLHAICVRSGNLAHYSFRISNNTKIIEIGEKNKYEPLSREEYWKETNK